mmetsp:Transcript_53911/g.107159  ORF Transcript_53911/g.107159 Transcript_53911/m.107159 type:complete len:280 (-) Transcript_53911:283-1122(-)
MVQLFLGEGLQRRFVRGGMQLSRVPLQLGNVVRALGCRCCLGRIHLSLDHCLPLNRLPQGLLHPCHLCTLRLELRMLRLLCARLRCRCLDQGRPRCRCLLPCLRHLSPRCLGRGRSRRCLICSRLRLRLSGPRRVGMHLCPGLSVTQRGDGRSDLRLLLCGLICRCGEGGGLQAASRFARRLKQFAHPRRLCGVSLRLAILGRQRGRRLYLRLRQLESRRLSRCLRCLNCCVRRLPRCHSCCCHCPPICFPFCAAALQSHVTLPQLPQESGHVHSAAQG